MEILGGIGGVVRRVGIGGKWERWIIGRVGGVVGVI